jgi:hypothetical protein
MSEEEREEYKALREKAGIITQGRIFSDEEFERVKELKKKFDDDEN